MGEAKRRKELGIPPREKTLELKKTDRNIYCIPSINTIIKKYPYVGVATMALGAIIFLASGGFNTIS